MREILHISIKQRLSTCADLSLAPQVDTADLNILSASSDPLLTGYLLSCIQLGQTLCRLPALAFSDGEIGP